MENLQRRESFWHHYWWKFIYFWTSSRNTVCPTGRRLCPFLEQSEEDGYYEFTRNLAAILQAYPQPKAVLIGRFPKECQMTQDILIYILDKHPILKTIPVMYDLDFAHTQPLFTITIGAKASIDTDSFSISIRE